LFYGMPSDVLAHRKTSPGGSFHPIKQLRLMGALFSPGDSCFDGLPAPRSLRTGSRSILFSGIGKQSVKKLTGISWLSGLRGGNVSRGSPRVILSDRFGLAEKFEGDASANHRKNTQG
jgi:hypothetical protein